MTEKEPVKSNASDQLNILNDIIKERNKQDQDWGIQNHPMELWYTILGEEFGEVGNVILESKFAIDSGEPTNDDHLRKELVQLAAVAMAMIEQIDRVEDQK